MGQIINKSDQGNLPLWTWVAPFPIFLVGGFVSLFFKSDTGIVTFYLPTALSVILVNWWGPKRTLPWLYISATLLTPLGGVETWWQWFIYPLCEVSYAALSWFLFTYLVKGKYWIPNTRQLVLFIVLGILLPLIFDLLSLQLLLVLFGEQPKEFFWIHLLRNWLGEFTANFGICLPLLYYFTGRVQQKKWLLHPPDQLIPKPLLGANRTEVRLIYTLLFIITFFMSFEKYWFLYGLAGLYIAIRFGFGEALLCNFYIFFITYVFPVFTKPMQNNEFSKIDTLLTIFIGNVLLYIFVAITGRVITDLRETEDKLNVRNVELEQANKELDRFVYSASHDLSAPLKSIQGLVNISKLDNSAIQKEEYLNKIGQSVSKLDSFIKEILDYSRNNRIGLQPESISLKELTEEVIENLRYLDDYHKMEFDLSGITKINLTTDKLRLKIILNNLFSNAIKFQKKRGNDLPQLRVSHQLKNDFIEILVIDHGEGIHPEVIDKIFEMFFRGNTHSIGSGLGLYIAQEAAEKLGGKISVNSELDKGSTFTVKLPLNKL